MSLERIYIGPNIPLLSNLSLVSVSKQGEVVRSGAEALLASASNQPTNHHHHHHHHDDDLCNHRQIVDADVEYDGGFSMSVSLNTKVTLPATSFEMPASAVLSVERLSGRVRCSSAPRRFSHSSITHGCVRTATSAHCSTAVRAILGGLSCRTDH